MTTLVTGATGFVGSHVARQLVGAGHSVRVLVRHNSNLRLLDGLPVERVEGDLRDASSLDRAMKGVRQVFHVAADYRLVDAQSRQKSTRAMWKARDSLFEVAGRAGVERIVYTSTVATIAVPTSRRGVFRTKKRTRLSTQMIGHYKRSKFLAEARSHESRSGGCAGCDRESDHAGRPGRLEADSDGPHHPRFSERQNARLCRYGTECRARRRCCGWAFARRRKGPRRRAVHSGRAQHDAEADSGRACGDYGASCAARATAACCRAGCGICRCSGFRDSRDASRRFRSRA